MGELLASMYVAVYMAFPVVLAARYVRLLCPAPPDHGWLRYSLLPLPETKLEPHQQVSRTF